MCIKVAILTNWLRIFVPTGQRNFTFWMLHVMIWSNILYYVITTVTEVFRCWPRKMIWDLFYTGPGVCRVDVDAQNFATSVINFVSDTTILALPQWMIWRLNMSKKRRWGLSLLFMIGVWFVQPLAVHVSAALICLCQCLVLRHSPRTLLRETRQIPGRNLQFLGRCSMDHLGADDGFPDYGHTCFSSCIQGASWLRGTHNLLQVSDEQDGSEQVATLEAHVQA